MIHLSYTILKMILIYYAVRGEKMKVSNQIKKYRKNAEMTQTELAEKLYTTRQTVSKWEQGTIEPNIDMLIQLAQLFDVTVDELVTGEQSINKSSHKQGTYPTNMWDFLIKRWWVLIIALIIICGTLGQIFAP